MSDLDRGNPNASPKRCFMVKFDSAGLKTAATD
jgi:hypothetical protein